MIQEYEGRSSEYVVEAVLDKRTTSNGYEYLVQWEDVGNPTWEPERHMRRYVPNMIDEFDRRRASVHSATSAATSVGVGRRRKIIRGLWVH